MDLSIITTVKNDISGIYQSILSVIYQKTDLKFEYIIVDASDDKTTSLAIKDVIKNHKKKIKHFKYIKSKDNSVYSGLNTGIKQAKGNYIGIVHSGDVYFSDKVLKKISNIIRSKKPNLIVGNAVYFDFNKIIRWWKSKYYNNYFQNLFNLPHTSTFVKKEILVKYQYYSTDYLISGDLDFFLKISKDEYRNSIYLNENFIFMQQGGLSTNLIKFPIKIFEDLIILFKNLSLFFIIFYFFKLMQKIPNFFYYKKNENYLLKRFLEISKL